MANYSIQILKWFESLAGLSCFLAFVVVDSIVISGIPELNLWERLKKRAIHSFPADVLCSMPWCKVECSLKIGFQANNRTVLRSM